jgi:hypothetical protein
LIAGDKIAAKRAACARRRGCRFVHQAISKRSILLAFCAVRSVVPRPRQLGTRFATQMARGLWRSFITEASVSRRNHGPRG